MKGSIDYPVAEFTETLVQSVGSGDSDWETTLYHVLRLQLLRSARYSLGADGEDCIHDVFIVVLRALRMHALRDPVALWGFARLVFKRHLYDIRSGRKRFPDSVDFYYVSLFISDPQPTPEQAYWKVVQLSLLNEALSRLKPKQREILNRFYFKGESAAEVRSSMRLTDTQFRLLKSRAKARAEKMMHGTCRPRVAYA